MNRSTDVAAELAERAIPSTSPTAERVVPSPSPAAVAVALAVNTDDPYDYGTDAIPDDAAVAKAFVDLDRMTLAAERLTEQRKKAEEHLGKLKAAEEQLLNKDIPELLAKMHLDDCTASSGIFVKVKRDIRVSLPGHDRIEARMAAFRWLVDQGHGGVIKNQISIALDRGEDARADELVVKLRAEGYEAESKKDVHSSTLSALGRELVADGKILPSDRFNFFDQRVAKLTRK